MFRISKVEGRSRTVVTIDGHLARDYVQTAETCCEQAIALGKSVHVFLREVSEVDVAGRNLLSRLAARGCCLHASGVYTSYIVRRLQSAAADSRTSADGRHIGGGTGGSR